MQSASSIEIPVRTILYWAESRPGNYERFDIVKHVVSKTEVGDVHSKAGAALSRVTIETRDFMITSARAGENAFGADGWKIDREKEMAANVMPVGDSNDVVAFYDTSLTSPFK
jgi:hypothetical protein